MGGQACVFYGAAQVSKDVDFLISGDAENLRRLRTALDALEAVRIAVPRFDSEALARGHAVHFRCHAEGVEGLRIDLMTKLRDMLEFDLLWERRMVVADENGVEFHLLSVQDLVRAKKTQRSKDWPMIEALVTVHFQENSDRPLPEWRHFWLMEARSAELLCELTSRFPSEAAALQPARPLLALTTANKLPALREALDAEIRSDQEKDRIYWEPLKREMEGFRQAERESKA